MTDITKIEDDERADNEGVDRLATAMKAKLKAKRLEGYHGWHNDCSMPRLRRLFDAHVPKGDILDVANFAMMIWNRENPNAAVALPEEVPTKPLTSLAAEAIDLTIRFLREIVCRTPEVRQHSDIEAFILNELQPAKVMANKDRTSCYALTGLLAKARRERDEALANSPQVPKGPSA